MLVRCGLAFAFLIASATSLAKGVDNGGMSSSLKDGLHQIAVIYKVHDCDSDLSDQAEDNLMSACSEALQHPEIASTHGAMTCTYDLQNYMVSVHTTVTSPSYKVSPNGDVEKILKGDLAVTAGQCQDLAKQQDGDEDSVVHHSPATEDLCLAYYPDKHFSEFQDKSECGDHRAPAATSDDDEDSDPANVAVDSNDIDRAAASDQSSYDSALLSEK